MDTDPELAPTAPTPPTLTAPDDLTMVDIIADNLVASDILAHLTERGKLEWELALEKTRSERLRLAWKQYIRDHLPTTPPPDVHD